MEGMYPKVPPYVVTEQPFQVPVTNPFMTMNNGWRSGLCDCCSDPSQCCYAYFCWCCFVGSLASSINESLCSCWCVPYSLAMYRMKVRSTFQIDGDTCNDHLTTICCPFCSALQMRNELRNRGIP